MMFALVILVLTVFTQPSLSPRPAGWSNFLPWSKDMPESEYKKHIYLLLVDKDWKPKLQNMPDHDNILPKYPGTVHDAYDAIVDPKNIYTSNQKPVENALELLTGPFGYDPQLESIFISHTISGNAKAWMVRNIIIAMAMRNMVKHYNVFAIDMRGLESSIEQTVVKSFFGLKTNYYAIGNTIGEFFDSAIKQQLIKADHIHLIGFCWSAQLSGYIARHIKERNNEKVKSVLALDPHSLGVSRLRHSVLAADDAQVVHAYHTNSLSFGTLRRTATVDFVINSGLMQPGCYATGNRMCSHRRAVTILWYLIIYPDLFLARKCSSWLAFQFCRCNKEDTTPITFPPTPGVVGKFYINTMSHKPYGYGAEGSICFVKNKDKNAVIVKKENYLTKNP